MYSGVAAFFPTLRQGAVAFMSPTPVAQRHSGVEVSAGVFDSHAFAARAFHAARTFASRSAEIPARNFPRRASGSVLNQSSVALAVSSIGTKVNPAFTAR